MRFRNPFRAGSIDLLEATATASLTSGAGLVNLTETVLTEDVSKRIDKEKGIIRGVKIRGPKSENGRDYDAQCDQDGVRLYEGCEVNINHPPNGKEASDRTIIEGWGVLRNVTIPEGGGNSGDLHYLKEHADTPLLLERYEKGFPLGLSHNAVGKVGVKGGKRIVESLQKVRSVDLVRKPATTRNLHESLDGETTVGEWAILFETEDSELAALVEAMAADPKASPAPMNYSPENGETDQIKSAIIAAISAVADIERLKSVLKGLLGEDSNMNADDKNKAPVDKQTTEAVATLTEQLKADDKGKAALSVLTEALAAKNAPVKPEKEAEASALKTLTEKVNAQEAEMATLRRDKRVSTFMEANKLTRQSLGPDRVKLLEACADEPAMKTLLATWPASVKNIAPPRGQLQNVTESVATAPKTAGDVRALLRS